MNCACQWALLSHRTSRQNTGEGVVVSPFSKIFTTQGSSPCLCIAVKSPSITEWFFIDWVTTGSTSKFPKLLPLRCNLGRILPFTSEIQVPVSSSPQSKFWWFLSKMFEVHFPVQDFHAGKLMWGQTPWLQVKDHCGCDFLPACGFLWAVGPNRMSPISPSFVYGSYCIFQL